MHVCVYVLVCAWGGGRWRWGSSSIKGYMRNLASYLQKHARNSDINFLLELYIGFYFWLHEHFKSSIIFFLGFYTHDANPHSQNFKRQVGQRARESERKERWAFTGNGISMIKETQKDKRWLLFHTVSHGNLSKGAVQGGSFTEPVSSAGPASSLSLMSQVPWKFKQVSCFLPLFSFSLNWTFLPSGHRALSLVSFNWTLTLYL